MAKSKSNEEQISALDWVLHTTSAEPKRPKHLRSAASQMRALEWRIREAERGVKEQVEKLYDTVIRHENTVYIGLSEQLVALTGLMHFLNGLRRAYETVCRCKS